MTTESLRHAAKEAGDEISTSEPEKQFEASLLLNMALRRDVWGRDGHNPPTLKVLINTNVLGGRYDACLLNYSDEELERLDKVIDHKRDFDYTYATIVWWMEKYLVQDRASGTHFETPQFAIMVLAMALYSGRAPEKRFDLITDLYEQVSKLVVSQPTPVRAGLRTPLRQFASCVLAEMDDTLDSIGHTNLALMKYGAGRAGLGLNISKVRSQGSSVASGEVVSTGVIPFLKMVESTIKSTSQHGIRSASATVFFPFWHAEVESLLIAKSPLRGSHDRKAFKLDYCMVVARLFHRRALQGKNITLFNPDEVPELYESWGTENFEKTYEECEARTDLKTRLIKPAVEILNLALEITLETGRLYYMHIDNCNTHSSFVPPVRMSNLCMEVTHPTVPIQHIDGDGRIGICILGAINSTEITPENIGRIAYTTVSQLDTLIDYQNYPVRAGEQFCKYWRSLGIGLTNFAAWLAREGLTYDHPDAPNRAAELMEMVQWHLLDASCKLAEELGAAPGFGETKYALGLLPIDHYATKLDEVVTAPLKMDWEGLRARIAKHGLRNCTLSAQMPCESSSVVQNVTNGIDPIRSEVSYKKAKSGPVRMLAPRVVTKNGTEGIYQHAFEMDGNRGFLNIVAALQKFTDMSISANMYFRYSKYEGGRIPLELILKEQLAFFRIGGKTLYYIVSDDGDKQTLMSGEATTTTNNDVEVVVEEAGCASGACSL